MSDNPRVFGSYDQAELDLQYNNRSRVPEHGRYFSRWREASAVARQHLLCRLDLSYGPGERERLDVFPAGPGAPSLLFFHGGYWQALDKSDFSYLAPPWVAAGVSLVVASYPLAPNATMDGIVEAVGRAALFVSRQAADWGGSADRLFSAGHSAGGHLVAMLMTKDWGGGRRPFQAGIALSGLYDLEAIRQCYLNRVLGLDPAMAHRNSPLERGATAWGRLLIAVGAAESTEFHRHNNEMAALWRARGLPLEEVAMPGRDHFSAIDALAEPEHALFRASHALVTGNDYGM